MFKKTLLAALLFSMITGCSITEETKNVSEEEEISPITQCDEQYNECVEKCGDPASETCIAQCQAAVEQCYVIVQSGTEDVPTVEDQEAEPETVLPSEDQEAEPEVVPPSEESETEPERVPPEVE